MNGSVSGGNSFVDDFGLLHPLVTLAESYVLSIGLGVAKLGERLELFL